MPIQTAADSISNSAGSPYGFKNRIINGAMAIDQRNGGASVNTSGAWTYPVDRFSVITGGTGGAAVFAAQRSTIAPTGFTNSLSLTLTTVDSSKASTELSSIRYPVEGIDCRDLMYGTSGAVTTTLSFWVRSSLIGTYCVKYGNSANDRSYVATYTINVSNTWEYKTVIIPGDTTGTWVNDTTACGIQIWWDLGSGSSYNTTAGSWTAGTYQRTTAQADVTGTSGATFYITGVQLEKGSQATAFDYRGYGHELALCQRYYFLSDSTAGYAYWLTGYQAGGYTASIYLYYVVPMRTTPTITSNGTWSLTNCTTPGTLADLKGYAFYVTLSATGAYSIRNAGSAYLTFSAEL